MVIAWTPQIRIQVAPQIPSEGRFLVTGQPSTHQVYHGFTKQHITNKSMLYIIIET